MRKIIALCMVLSTLRIAAQDTTMNSLTKDMEVKGHGGSKRVKIFESERLINANTTEPVGKGKMDFKVTHNFGDVAGSAGGLKNFFGLDNSTDVRIGFHIGITDRLTLSAARAKGGGAVRKTQVPQLYELGIKYELLKQLENDPSHPLSLSIFASNTISTVNSSFTASTITNPLDPRFGQTNDTALNFPDKFPDFGDRNAQVVQLTVAKKVKRVSGLLNFTLVHQGYVPLRDQQTMFAIGGALRIPLSKSINFLVDYMHPFRSKSSKDYFKNADNSYNPPGDIDQNIVGFNFYDPLGIGFEIITPGHVFHLNFTNSTEILESRLIPYTTKAWHKGEFRWGFNLSRTFVLWRVKK